MNSTSSKAVVLSTARTPFGKLGGGLASLEATTLGAVALAAAIERAGIDPSDVEHAIFGQVLQAGAGQNPARQVVFKANLAKTVTAETVNKVCASGLLSIVYAMRSINAGARSVVVSLGPDGLLAVTEEGCWRARPRVVAGGNGTGAGDAATAALARGLLLGQPWPMRLAHAAALGAAAVAAPVAGEFSHADYEQGVGLVTVERLAVPADCPVTDRQAREQAVGASVEGDR